MSDRQHTYSTSLEFFCESCKERLDIKVVEGKEGDKIMVYPCPGCMNNAECDGYHQREDELRGAK